MNPNLAIIDEYHQHKPKCKKCYNCIYAGSPFKIVNKTHMHCEDPNQYNKDGWEKGEFTEWDTLREFWQTCKSHKLKIILKKTNSPQLTDQI